MIRVLFIDDDPQAQATLAMILADRYAVLPAYTASEGLRELHDQDPDVVLLDIDLPDRDGLSLLEDIVASPAAPPVIMLTAYGEVDFVKRAIQAGAYDFILKDFSLRALDGALQRAVQNADARRLFLAGPSPEGFAGMVGESPPMRELKSLIARYAASDAPALIQGESGAGRSWCGMALHRLSPRREGPLVAVNCGAIPESLLESELFGAERGAFTDAVSRPGCFERANRGTIFLDEIGELAPAAQVKLLRALENQELTRVGGTEAVRLNVRVVGGHQQGPAPPDRAGALPRGPVLPDQRAAPARAASAGTARGHPPAGRALYGQPFGESGAVAAPGGAGAAVRALLARQRARAAQRAGAGCGPLRRRRSSAPGTWCGRRRLGAQRRERACSASSTQSGEPSSAVALPARRATTSRWSLSTICSGAGVRGARRGKRRKYSGPLKRTRQR